MGMIYCEQTDVCMFAAEELQNYLLRINGDMCRINPSVLKKGRSYYVGTLDWMMQQGIDVSFAEGLQHDGYAWAVKEQGVYITSLVDRGVVFGVYALLKKAGCRWLFPGEYGEFLPNRLELEMGSELSNPVYTARIITDDTKTAPLESFVRESIQKVDWACKNGINTYYLNYYPGDNWGEAEIVRAMIEQRGMLLEIGGHGTPMFVDRSLFESKPEMFRMDASGQRRKDGNFCTASIEAQQMITTRIQHEVSVNTNKRPPHLHMYFADAHDGAWCYCEKCRDKSASEQMLMAVNHTAKALEKTNPRVTMDYLLYHDTLDITQTNMKPHSNVSGFYAPRERCYSHSIGDPSCPRNVKYLEDLKNALKVFGKISVFEYYADMILWNKMTTELPEIIVQDMRDYASLGIREMDMLMFNCYSWFAYPLNMYTYTQAVWNPQVEAKDIVDEFNALCYADSAEAMGSVREKLMHATALYLTFCGYKTDYVMDIRWIPPTDAVFFRQHMSNIARALELFHECEAEIENILQIEMDAKVKARLQRQLDILEITCLQLSCTYTMMEGNYRCKVENAGDDYMRACCTKAISIMQQLISFNREFSAERMGVNGRAYFAGHLGQEQLDWIQSLYENPRREGTCI